MACKLRDLLHRQLPLLGMQQVVLRAYHHKALRHFLPCLKSEALDTQKHCSAHDQQLLLCIVQQPTGLAGKALFIWFSVLVNGKISVVHVVATLFVLLQLRLTPADCSHQRARSLLLLRTPLTSSPPSSL